MPGNEISCRIVFDVFFSHEIILWGQIKVHCSIGIIGNRRRDILYSTVPTFVAQLANSAVQIDLENR